jgi:hypothetical protein
MRPKPEDVVAGFLRLFEAIPAVYVKEIGCEVARLFCVKTRLTFLTLE